MPGNRRLVCNRVGISYANKKCAVAYRRHKIAYIFARHHFSVQVRKRTVGTDSLNVVLIYLLDY